MNHQFNHINFSPESGLSAGLRLILILVLPVFMLSTAFLNTMYAQDSTSVMEKRLESLGGKDKLFVLNQLTASYLEENNAKKALRYAKRAQALADAIIHEDNNLISEADFYLKPLTYLWLGLAYKQRGHYMESKEALQISLAEAKKLDLPELVYKAQWNLEDIDAAINATGKDKKIFMRNAFETIGSGVNKTTADLNLNATLKLAGHHENNGNNIKAIEYYSKAMEQLKDQGDWVRAYEIKEHIGDLLGQEGQYNKALEVYKEIGNQVGDIEDSAGVARIEGKSDVIREHIDELLKDDEQDDRETTPAPSFNQLMINESEGNADSIRIMAEQAEETQDYQTSLYYFKEYLAMEQKLASERRTQELVLLEKVNEIENREREITLLKQQEEINALQLEQNNTELSRQYSFKRNLMIGLGLLSILVLAFYLLYRNKRRDHKKLGIAYHDLELTKDELKDAQQRIKILLYQQVSGAIADELLSNKDELRVERRFVCIMFLDIRDFTPYVEKLDPEDIIEYQNQVFGFMIDTVNRRQGIVNQI